LPTHIPALNSAEIAFNKVVHIIDGVKLGRVIYMGGNYHATFHINLEISSIFLRTSRAVFNDVFLVKEEECADIEKTLSLNTLRTGNADLSVYITTMQDG
jgi:hypothetical protein